MSITQSYVGTKNLIFLICDVTVLDSGPQARTYKDLEWNPMFQIPCSWIRIKF